MKMTCDEAFEALTGPSEFSAGDLRSHLAACPRCREMSDVLAPALALFAGEAPREAPPVDQQFATGTEASGAAAGTLLSPAAIRADDHAARALASQSPRRRTVLLPGVLRIAAVFVLGIATAFGIAGLRSGPQAAENPATNGSCLWIARNAQSAEDLQAEHVILSCVACHLPAASR
jgi:hypothetical protein